MKNVRNIAILFLSLLILTNSGFSQVSNYKIIAKIELGSEGKSDYLTVDEQAHRLYISNFTKVHVVDISTNKEVGVIDNLSGVHGIALASEFNKGFISNGGNNTVTVFDLKTNKVIETIKITGKKPDAIVYEPFTKRIFSFNGGSEDATAIDAKTNKIYGTLPLESGPEFSASDRNGKMFVNIEEKNDVVCFDPKNLKVLETWPLAPCATPTGMAMDIENNRLFIGGRNKLMAVLDAGTGKVITTLPIGTGVDACVYDNKTKLVFCSCKDGTITVIKQESKDKYTVIDNIKTLPGAKTMAIDRTTQRLYTSTILDKKEENGKSVVVFGVLVLDNK